MPKGRQSSLPDKQTGRVPQENRLRGYPFNRRDAELQSEAQFPKDPRWNDENTYTNERHPTMELEEAPTRGKIGKGRQSNVGTMSETWDGDAEGLSETNVRMQFVYPDEFDSPSE